MTYKIHWQIVKAINQVVVTDYLDWLPNVKFFQHQFLWTRMFEDHTTDKTDATVTPSSLMSSENIIIHCDRD